MWHRSATPSSGSLFPSDRHVLTAVAVYSMVGAGCTGFRPTASAPYGACIPTGPVLVGLRSFLSVATHTLRAGSVMDLLWGLLLALRPVHVTLPIRNSCVVLGYDFVLLAPVSLPYLGRMGCAVGLRVGCLRFLVYVVFFARWA